MRSFPNIKNLQLELPSSVSNQEATQVCGSHWDGYFSDRHDMVQEGFYITDILLTTTAALAPSNLATLKIKFACLCSLEDTMLNERYHRLLLSTFEPLKQLKIKEKVTFIATPKMSSKAYSHDIPRPASGSCSSYHGQRTRDEQCVQPACIALAAAFSEMADLLTNPTAPRPQLSFYAKRWINLRARAAPVTRMGLTLRTELFQLLKVVMEAGIHVNERHGEDLDKMINYLYNQTLALVQRLEFWIAKKGNFNKEFERRKDLKEAMIACLVSHQSDLLRSERRMREK
ncbi:MAG: hypothetical protein Q9218_006307 [Villophora microphyllina]